MTRGGDCLGDEEYDSGDRQAVIKVYIFENVLVVN